MEPQLTKAGAVTLDEPSDLVDPGIAESRELFQVQSGTQHLGGHRGQTTCGPGRVRETLGDGEVTKQVRHGKSVDGGLTCAGEQTLRQALETDVWHSEGSRGSRIGGHDLATLHQGRCLSVRRRGEVDGGVRLPFSRHGCTGRFCDGTTATSSDGVAT